MSDIRVHEISTQSQQGSKTLYECIRVNYKTLPPFEIIQNYEEKEYRRWSYLDSKCNYKPKVFKSIGGELLIYTSVKGRFIKIREKDGIVSSVSMVFTGGSKNTAGKLIESLQKISDRNYVVRVYLVGETHSYLPENFDIHVINTYKREISLKEEIKAS